MVATLLSCQSFAIYSLHMQVASLASATSPSLPPCESTLDSSQWKV